MLFEFVYCNNKMCRINRFRLNTYNKGTNYSFVLGSSISSFKALYDYIKYPSKLVQYPLICIVIFAVFCQKIINNTRDGFLLLLWKCKRFNNISFATEVNHLKLFLGIVDPIHLGH